MMIGDKVSLSRRDLLVGTAALLAAIPPADAAKPPSAKPPGHRGVNLSHWFAQSFEGYSLAHYEHFVGAHRLTELARLGFDHVRLPVDPLLLFVEQPAIGLRTELVFFLKNVVRLILSEGLGVILDLHPVEASEKSKLLRPDYAAAFVKNWGLLACDLSEAELPICFEIMNEPSPLVGDAWWALQQSIINAIRRADTSAIIIANGGGWSGIEDLTRRTPYPDKNVIYTVHYYNPILFTQQSAEWGWSVAERVADLGWPVGVAKAEAAARQSTRDAEAFDFVRDAIASGSFTSLAMSQACQELTLWQQAHGHPRIYVGEFGVIARRAPPAARILWLRAARREFEARGWGWALWDLSPTFGMLRTKSNEQVGAWDGMRLDVDTLEALGMAA